MPYPLFSVGPTSDFWEVLTCLSFSGVTDKLHGGEHVLLEAA